MTNGYFLSVLPFRARACVCVCVCVKSEKCVIVLTNKRSGTTSQFACSRLLENQVRPHILRTCVCVFMYVCAHCHHLKQ